MNPLLSEIEMFIATHEMSEWKFGQYAMNDRHFVKQLRNGRRLWPETETRVREFIATYAPARQVA